MRYCHFGFSPVHYSDSDSDSEYATYEKRTLHDMIRQRHLRDGFLKEQGTSTFAIVNPEFPIRRDKVTNHLHVRGIQYRTTSDSWRFLPDVISGLKCNLCVKICDFEN